MYRREIIRIRKVSLTGVVARELWVRYVWSRAFQRYRVYGDRLSEITMIDREKPVFKRVVKSRSESPGIPPIRRDESK